SGASMEASFADPSFRVRDPHATAATRTAARLQRGMGSMVTPSRVPSSPAITGAWIRGGRILTLETMADRILRVTLFVPGAKSMRGVRLGGEVEVEWIDNDGDFGNAFAMGTVADDVVARIAAAPGALLLHWFVDLKTGRT